MKFSVHLTILATLCLAGGSNATASVRLIEKGQINCVVILPRHASELQAIAVEDFCSIMKQATGGDLKIAHDLKEAKGLVPIVVGPGELTRNMGFSGEDLNPEEFRIVVRDNAIVILAKDIPNKSKPEAQSMVTAWAFAYLADRYMGVVRLWPGELGTAVPEISNLALPEMDIREQPKLFYRSFRNAYDPDINLWNAFYQSSGFRETRITGHSFREGKSNGDWWERFHIAKPEMLARDPDGNVGHSPGKPHFCKICISNPEVTDEIIRIWQAAGAPDYWDVTPNDGTCFCTCENCRELDRLYGGVDYTPEEIWTRPAHVSLTDRYVWFWNQLITQMREINANAKIGVYFYSAYRQPPKNLRLEPGIYGAMVPVLDIGNWDAWIAAGASEIGLRPNWWYMGACGPSLHLHKMGNYIEHARDTGMVLVTMDSLYGYWATQGIKYYLVARLAQRWDLTTEDVIAEYCNAFGEAAPEIRRYFDYWEAYDAKVAWNIPAGGMSSVDPNGLYETYCRENYGSVLHPLRGHWQTLSAMFNTSVITAARDILQSARNAVSDPLTLKRIDFLEAGLDHVELCGQLVDAEKANKIPWIERIRAFNNEMEKAFGYWGTRELFVLNHWGLLGEDINVDDM